jgi:hypothetical protein
LPWVFARKRKRRGIDPSVSASPGREGKQKGENGKKVVAWGNPREKEFTGREREKERERKRLKRWKRKKGKERKEERDDLTWEISSGFL